MKKCTNCKLNKEQTYFYTSCDYECRSCILERHRNSYDPAKEKERNKSKNRKQQFIISKNKMLLKYPEKIKARTAVRLALNRGDIVKKPCEVCSESKVHAHHVDYSKPLEIMWLCRKHHDEWHRNN